MSKSRTDNRCSTLRVDEDDRASGAELQRMSGGEAIDWAGLSARPLAPWHPAQGRLATAQVTRASAVLGVGAARSDGLVAATALAAATASKAAA
eukprot:6982730-Alexandrium_andersonii.AAC.1